MQEYLGTICDESAAVQEKLAAFEATLANLQIQFANLEKGVEKHDQLAVEKKQELIDANAELHDAYKAYEADRASLLTMLDSFRRQFASALPETNDQQHDARQAFDPIADAIRGLVKQVDMIYKFTVHVGDLAGDLAGSNGKNGALDYDRRVAGRLIKQLDEQRKAAIEQMKHVAYFHRQVVWLQDRFPKAELQAVPGLVKLVDRAEIEAADWSLTPGHYVGVAPPETDEDFDFEQALRDIHIELAELNQEAAQLAEKIQMNLDELVR